MLLGASSVAVILWIKTMTPNSANDPLPIFKDGKLKLGIYKIHNLHSQTFIDHPRTLSRGLLPGQPHFSEREGDSYVQFIDLLFVSLTIRSGRSGLLGLYILQKG
jgi:hypothetical protein